MTSPLSVSLQEEDYPGAIQLCLECQKAASTFKHYSCIRYSMSGFLWYANGSEPGFHLLWMNGWVLGETTDGKRDRRQAGMLKTKKKPAGKTTGCFARSNQSSLLWSFVEWDLRRSATEDCMCVLASAYTSMQDLSTCSLRKKILLMHL